MRLLAIVKTILYAGLISLAGNGLSNAITVPVCEGQWPLTLEGFETLDAMRYLDMPDQDAMRATTAIELELSLKLGREEIAPPLVKSYCQIGLTRMVVEFFVPFEDDAILGDVTRAIYRWSTDGDMPAGWQISKIGKRNVCVRSRNQTTGLCQ